MHSISRHCVVGGDAACGSPADSITLFDSLDGGCAWFMGLPASLATPRTCSSPIYNVICGSFQGTLYIVYSQSDAARTSPGTQGFLDVLGLGKINSVGNLFVTALPATWTGTIAPLFLPSLVRVQGGLSVVGTDASKVFPVTAVLGLNNVAQVGNTLAFQNTLIEGPDLASLRCVGGALAFIANPKQTTLRGLDSLVAVNYANVFPSGPVIVIKNLTMLGAGALSPLARAASCGGMPAPLRPSISTPSCSNPIGTWPALCEFLTTTKCP